MHDEPEFTHRSYPQAEIEHGVRLIWESKQRFREAGFDLRAVAGPTPDAHSVIAIGVPSDDEAVSELSPELVAAAREVVAEVLRESLVDPIDVKIEDAKSREEWFGGPSI